MIWEKGEWFCRKRERFSANRESAFGKGCLICHRRGRNCLIGKPKARFGIGGAEVTRLKLFRKPLIRNKEMSLVTSAPTPKGKKVERATSRFWAQPVAQKRGRLVAAVTDQP
jgi:hypothetical protein